MTSNYRVKWEVPNVLDRHALVCFVLCESWSRLFLINTLPYSLYGFVAKEKESKITYNKVVLV